MKDHSRSVFIGAVILMIFVLVAAVAIVRLTSYERERDLGNWQLTLGVLADAKAGLVEKWVEAQFAVLKELADNGSMQLYAQQLDRNPVENQSVEPAEISYLRNLIRATAERQGFRDQEPSGGRINANVAWHANNALILFDRNLAVIATTPGMPEMDDTLSKALAEVLASGKRALFDLHLNANGRAAVGFLVPVFGLQPQGGQPQAIAVLYGVRDATETLFPLLIAQKTVTHTDETLLVESKGDLLIYLSPLADGTLALKKSLAANVTGLAEAEGLRHPGMFGRLRDYSGKETLFTSRTLANLPWFIIQKIELDEAMAESRAHQRFLFVSLVLFLLLASALMVAAWWYGSTIRERSTAKELRSTYLQLRAQTDLLQAINNHITDYLFLLDGQDHFVFANRALAAGLAMATADFHGKNLISVLGPHAAKALQTPCRVARQENRVVALEMKTIFNETVHDFLATFVPVTLEGGDRNAVLASLHDVTLLQEARRKKERLGRQIVTALMRAIDLHDPYSANHSANTTAVALAIARAMGADPHVNATLEIAANLCNLGKLFIPREVLTKSGALTADEQAMTRQETTYAREILSQIDFELPILETIAQKHEYLDGTGYPAGLAGEAIILPARILAVANAFVAMISPRAYRDRLGVKEALAQLLAAADRGYDRQTVAALFHVAENTIDWPAFENGRGILLLHLED